MAGLCEGGNEPPGSLKVRSQKDSNGKQAFNRKRSIICGPLEKELRKRLVKWFAWSMALYVTETWTLRLNEEKRMEAFEMWIWRRKGNQLSEDSLNLTCDINNAPLMRQLSKEIMG
ncbi:hypothetical protein ANN_12121 [Periplaneta americana]|uniref:Uncharacterized protein n=1 Tax=Periplaneta americana TaxID=6978 RepID=A0ABQ8T6Y7_PERAM|nr:hypothetical protein ANN_12121 [Periplaneta americana]